MEAKSHERLFAQSCRQLRCAQVTQVAERDPTANDDGGYSDDDTDANLRDGDRYCLWCQEIVAARVLEKTGQLETVDAPSDINARGRWMYNRWLDTWRDRYWLFFELDEQIAALEDRYAAMTPGPAGEAIWRSDLYRPPRDDPHATSPAPGEIQDDELLLWSQ